MKEAITIIALIVSLLMNLFLGAFSYGKMRHFREETIKNNCAQYNPTTGDFEWIEKEKAE